MTTPKSPHIPPDTTPNIRVQSPSKQPRETSHVHLRRTSLSSPDSYPDMPLWSDRQILLRADNGPTLTVPRPFALIGRTDGSDLRIADRALSARHVYLHLDHRGLFAVDLATRTGTRFDGVAAPAAWLQPGSSIEIAGHHVEFLNPHPNTTQDQAYHLTDATEAPLARLSLHPLPSLHTPWSLNSELVFLGRSLACGVPIVGGSAARVHAVIVRTTQNAYIVNLAGWGIWLDGQLIRSAAPLEHGALLVAGSSRFEIRVDPHPDPPPRLPALTPNIHPESPAPPSLNLQKYNDPDPPNTDSHTDHPTLDLQLEPDPHHPPRHLADPNPLATLLPAGMTPPPGLLPADSQTALMGWLLGAVQTIQAEMLRRQDEFQHELVRAIHALHQDNQDALDLHQQRVDAIHKELSELREDIRKRFNSEIPTPRAPSLPKPPAPPPRITPPNPDSPPADPAAATAWLLNRVNRLDEANRSSWRDLLNRIGPKST